ncbi:hypothetical protein SAMN04489723_11596 [Algoriphagus aquimarinus]|uniref:Uncharacterized protein n=1 Tax=Algoriphagus aquimarinus TaxID=237018 RepID=A0A1I1BSQ3_9BACT|nr:hypothetical protein SAMN04489723_11596 [Algoriphagus aquimarinus]
MIKVGCDSGFSKNKRKYHINTKSSDKRKLAGQLKASSYKKKCKLFLSLYRGQSVINHDSYYVSIEISSILTLIYPLLISGFHIQSRRN